MKKYFSLIAALTLTLSACSDSVPKVDDPHNIVVDGNKMKAVAFLKKYCEGKTVHETCVKVQRAMVQDSTKGEVPRFK